MSPRRSAAALTLILLLASGCSGSETDAPAVDAAAGESAAAVMVAAPTLECLTGLVDAEVSESVGVPSGYTSVVGRTLAVGSVTIRTVANIDGASLVETSKLDGSTGRIAVAAALQSDPADEVEPEIELRRDNEAVYLTGEAWRASGAFNGADWLGMDLRGDSELTSQLVSFDPVAAAPLVGIEVLTSSPRRVDQLGEPGACGDGTQAWRVDVPSELAAGLFPNVALTVLSTSGVSQLPAGGTVTVDVLTDTTGVLSLRYDATSLIDAVRPATSAIPITVETELIDRDVPTTVDIPATEDVEWIADPVLEVAYRSGVVNAADADALSGYLSATDRFEQGVAAFMALYANPDLADEDFFNALPGLSSEITAAATSADDALALVSDGALVTTLEGTALSVDGIIEALALIVGAESVEGVDDAYSQFAFHEGRYRAAADVVADELRGMLGSDLLEILGAG